MQNPLNKRFKRELSANKGRYLALTIIFIVMVAIIGGFLVVANSVETVFENNRSDCLVEDGLFTAWTPVDDTVLDGISDLGINVYQNYYLEADSLTNATVRVYQNRTEVNLATVIEGRLPDTLNEISVDRLFAENNDISLGDTISISNTEMTVSGFISVPDYSSLFASNTDIMMDSFHFGIAVVNEDTFETFSEDQILYNYAYRYHDQALTAAERIDSSEELKEYLIEKNIALTNFLMAENNQSISYISDDMGSDTPMMLAFLFILVVILVFVYAIIISSTIESEAAVIGTLLSSGYKKHELVRHYLTLPILVTFISALIGTVISYTAVTPLFSSIYYSGYSLPPLELSFSLPALVYTVVIPIVILMMINIFVLWRKLSHSPLAFLRREIKHKRQRKARKLPDFSFVTRFRLRVILQNKGSYLILLAGILFASFLLTFGMCTLPSISRYIDQIEAAAVSDYQYILKAPFEPESDNGYEKFTIKNLEFYNSFADKDFEVSFYGLTANSIYFKGMELTLNEDEIVLSNSMAQKFGIKNGDILTFTDPYTLTSYSLAVAGFYDYPAGLSAFMPAKALNTLLDLDEDYFNGLLSDSKLEIDESWLATVITAEDMVNLGDQMLSTFGMMIPIMFVAAVIIYLVLMYILTKVVIDKNALHMAFMKVFGYKNKEIKKLYLNATSLTVIVSLVITLPLVYIGMTMMFSLAFIQVSGFIEIYIPPYMHATVVLTGMITYGIINFFHIRRINGIEMAEALKDRE